MKPGWKTTEFWLAAAAAIFGALQASGLLAEGSKWAKIVGLVVMALGSLGYSVSRGMAKRNGAPK